MISLGQKLKLHMKNMTVVLCKEPLQKTQNIREMRILKIGHFSKTIANAKAIAFAK